MALDAALRRRLAAVTGATGIDDGGVAHPANLQQIRELLAICAGDSVRVGPAAGAEGVALGVAADRLDAVRLDAAAMLIHAGAASTWQSVREEAATAGLAVSGLGATRDDLVGESAGAGEVSRRTVVGVDLLTHAGELVSAGGRTLKDVVGYDFPALVLGSGDRLGLILAVTLRLEPAGAHTPPISGPGAWSGDAGLDVAAAFRN